MSLSHRNPIFAFTVAALFGLCFATSARALPNVTGQWSLVKPLPYFPIHANLLPNSKVMIWPGDLGINGNDPRAWDPATQIVSPLSKPGFDMFCIEHTFLADGSLRRRRPYLKFCVSVTGRQVQLCHRHLDQPA